MKKILFGCMAYFMAINVNAQEFKMANVKDIALFPQQNEFRNAINISGIWKFKKDSLNQGEKEQWFNGLANSVSIAVPRKLE